MPARNFDASLVSLSYLDVALIEVLFRIGLEDIHLATQHFVVGLIDVVVYIRLHVDVTEGREEAVLYALFERVFVGVISEVFVGVDILVHPWGCGQAKLYGWFEVLQDASPVALVLCSASVALVYDDKVEEVFGVLSEVWRIVRAAHKGLEDGEEDAAVSGHTAVLGDTAWLDALHGIFLESAEVVLCLVGKDISVCQEEDARSSACLLQVPSCLEEFPSDLESDEGLARSCSEGEQNALLALCYALQDLADSRFLIVARLLHAIAVERLFVQFVAPQIRLTVDARPEFVRTGESVHEVFVETLAVHLVDVVSVRGVGETDTQHIGILLGLGHTFSIAQLVALGFHDGEFHALVDEDIVSPLWNGLLRLRDFPTRESVFGRDATSFHCPPASLFQLRVNLM